MADNVHAAHIHFGADARHECPTAGEDADNSGTLNTTEDAPAHGPVVVSLTKTGDTSPESVLAVDRFDTAPGGVAEPGALLGVTVHLDDGVVDIDQRVPLVLPVPVGPGAGVVAATTGAPGR